MNTIMNWLLAQINRVRTWQGNNHEQVEENVEQGGCQEYHQINDYWGNTQCSCQLFLS